MKIKVLPFIPHGLLFGGFEIQMIAAIDATREVGVDIAKMNVWSRENDFEILHLWGLENAHYSTIVWGRRAGKKIVISALLPYLDFKTYFKNMTANLLGKRRIQNKILSLVDQLVVVNENQAEAAIKLFGFPGNKISVVPNVIEDDYFNNGISGQDNERFGIDNYLICTGNVCRRKNQLSLAKAAIEENIPLLIVGNPHVGEDKYADALNNLIKNSAKIKWISELPYQSTKLISAYRQSKGFALISSNETQPISALEAAAMGKPLMLSDRAWAKQNYYRNAYLVDPSSLKSIKEGMRNIMNQSFSQDPWRETLEQCRRMNVGYAYERVYKRVMECVSGK